MDFTGFSREQVEAVITAAQEWLARDTAVWELRERYDWQVRELERLAALQGPIPASPVPSGGFMPGQVVDVDGTLYLNGSGGFITYAPGDEPISEWVHVEEPPEPGEPEPEPTPPAPDYDEWEQRYAHNAYMAGDRVLYDGAVYESIIDHNAHHPTITVAWKRVDQ